jgi:hypothetical protein
MDNRILLQQVAGAQGRLVLSKRYYSAKVNSALTGIPSNRTCKVCVNRAS